MIEKIKKDYENNDDLIIREISFQLHKIYVIFFDTLCSQDKINDYILKNITSVKRFKDIKNLLAASNVKKIDNYDKIEFYLFHGFTIILSNNDVYAVETKANLDRSISTNEVELSLKGPRNSFNENYQNNIGMLKRRIKNNNLCIDTINIGRISNTKVGILSIKGITKNELIKYVKEKLNNIDIDFINDGENLKKYLSNSKIFPTIINTERPDRCAKALCDGKVVIITEESPTALILPGFFIDFINPFSDDYVKSFNISITKIIRLACYFLSIMVPAYYIAIINYNQETIPTSLIINFAMQRNGVPFPSFIECLIMLILCEILRESDLRFPTKYGSAISILGALVIGDAAVNAGLVSPIMIIVISFTYISSLIFPEIEVVNSIRFYRLIFLLISACFGLYGLLMADIFLLINLIDTKSANLNYTFPISPFDKSYFFNTAIKRNIFKRSKYLTKNIIREK